MSADGNMNTNVNLERIKYGKPRKIDGRYMSHSKYLQENGHLIELQIETGYLKCIRLTENHIDLLLNEDDTDLASFFTNLDEYNIKTAYKNSEVWFNETLPLEVIDEYHKSFVKVHNGSPMIRVDIGKDMYMEMKNKVEGKFVKMFLKYEGLRFLKQQFTSIWSGANFDIERDIDLTENIFEEIGEMENVEEDKIPEVVVEKTAEVIAEKMPKVVAEKTAGVVAEKTAEIVAEKTKTAEVIAEKTKTAEVITEKIPDVSAKDMPIKTREKSQSRKIKVIKTAHKRSIWQ
jgi:hypothetical protein